MFSRYRYPLLAVLSLTLLGAVPLAQARDRHADFSIHLPHLSISSHHGRHAPHYDYYQPQVARHYHGRQLCHLSHDSGYAYGEQDHHYYYDRHPRYRDHYDRGNYYRH